MDRFRSTAAPIIRDANNANLLKRRNVHRHPQTKHQQPDTTHEKRYENTRRQT